MNTGVCVAALVGVVAVLYALLSTPTVLRDIVFGYPPANSSLANFGWPPIPRISEEDLDTFNRTGYVVIRQVVEPIVIELMLEEAMRGCSWPLFLSRFCYLRQTRWFVDLFRDFLFHGPVASIAHEFIGGKGVRVVQDGVFGVRNTWNPFIFSFLPHVDHGGNPGIYGRLHGNTSGVSAWMPLQDIDHKTDGGSIILYDNFTQNRCETQFGAVIMDNTVTVNQTESVPRCHVGTLSPSQNIQSFKKGDLVLWNPNMLHHTQQILKESFIRYAWHAWLVDSDAISCFVRDCWNRGEPCCNSAKLPQPGQEIHTPCYAQIYPSPLQDEVDAHFEDRPQPLITWRPQKAIPVLDLNHTCNLRHKTVG